MNGSHVAEHYTAYLEDRLPEALRREVEAHLRVCARCARELEEMRALVAELREMPEVPLPEGFAERVSARVPRRAPRVGWWHAPALAGGLLASALAVTLVVLHLGSPPVMQVADSQAGRESARMQTRAAEAELDATKDITGKNARADAFAPAEPVADMRRSPITDMPGVGYKGKQDQGNIDTVNDAGKPATRAVGRKEEMADASGNRLRVAALPKAASPPSIPPSPPVGDAKDVFGRVEINGAATAVVVPAERAVSRDALVVAEGHDDSPLAAARGGEPESALSSSVTPEARLGTDGSAVVKIAPSASVAAGARGAPGSPGSEGAPENGSRYGFTATTKSFAYDAAKLAPPALPLALGNLRVEAKSLPDGKGGAVSLRVDGAREIAATVATTQPSGVKEQTISLTPQAREMAVALPKGKQATVLAVTLRDGDAVECATLIAPAPGARTNKITLRATNQPAERVLATLATRAGFFVLAPRAFAARAISLDVKDRTPLEAASTLAAPDHRAELAGIVLYIIPAK